MGKVGKNILTQDDGLLLHSVPGEDLLFKVTGEDTDGALDYFVLDILPRSGPPLHLHHKQHETLHFLSGKFLVHIDGEETECDTGAFVHFPIGCTHAFMNISDAPAKVILTFTPGHTDLFFEEFSPIIRGFDGPPDPAIIAPLFAKHNWELKGPPLAKLHEGH